VLAGRLNQGAVERGGDVQRGGGQAGGFEFGLGFGDAGVRATEDDLAGAVEVGDPDVITGAEDALDFRGWGGDGEHFSCFAASGVGHGEAAGAGQTMQGGRGEAARHAQGD
jgi:hypothetical protein